MSVFELELASEHPIRFQIGDDDRIGAGKQGAVYSAEFDPTIAVKLYHQSRDQDGQRLGAMKLIATPRDFEIRPAGVGSHLQLAWPYELVRHPETKDIIGYTMPRYPDEEFLQLDVLWHPALRQEHLPEPNWLFLLSVALNLARVAAMVHERGLVLGDVRDANFVFSPRTSLVALLDCDSMPITDPHRDVHYLCELSHPDYAPPELQPGERAAGEDVPRSEHTDNFALAVLICRLLLAGDHPFAGYPSIAGDDEEDGDIGQNIRAGRSYLVAPNEILVAPETVPADVLPADVLKLARQAFSVGLREPSKRPRSATWRMALSASIKAVADCPNYPERHKYSSELWSCPWCQVAYDPFPLPPQPVEQRHDGRLQTVLVLSFVVLVVTLVALLSSHVI